MTADLLILGGGPAGLSTALHLVQRAPDLAKRILILEKARHPRHKLCGGGLTPDAEVILQGLGLDVSEIPHVDAAEARFDFAGRGLNINFRGTHTLRMIRRDEFDAWLAQKVRLGGVEIREGVTVRRVIPGDESVTVETDHGKFEAAIVVGADGSNGVTRRCTLPEQPIHTARALEVLAPASGQVAETSHPKPSLHVRKPSEKGYAGGVLPPAYPFSETDSPPPILGEGPGVGVRTTHAPNVAYFDFAPIPFGIAGYTWDFPTQVNGQPMRCWGIYDTNLLADQERPPLKRPLEEELQRHGGSLQGARVEGHPIRWFGPRSALSAPRILLVGDAAGADGIFGEGISFALGYGRLAAEAILDALRRNDFSFSSYRSRVLRSPLGQSLILRTAVTHVLYRLHWAWFQKFFWQVLKPFVRPVAPAVVLNWARRLKPAKTASLAKQ